MFKNIYLGSAACCLLLTTGCMEKPEKEISVVESKTTPDFN